MDRLQGFNPDLGAWRDKARHDSRYAFRAGTEGYCPVCGYPSDDRSKRKGYCTDCMKKAHAQFKQEAAIACQARDARHADYAVQYGNLVLLCQRTGTRELTLSPRNTGFCYWLKAQGVMDKQGVVRIPEEKTELEPAEIAGGF